MTIKTLTQAASALRPLLLMGLLLALPGQVMARDFTYQGVAYTVLDDEAKTCATRAGSADSPGNDFMDDVLDIPASVSDGTDTYTVTQIGAYSFADNYFIESIILPSTVRTIGDYAFNGNTVLETIDMAEGLENIGWYAFTDCASLKSFHIPNSVINVGKQVCANCRNLVDLTIGNSVIILGDEAFMNCSKIKSVYIPASIHSFGYRAFLGCSGMRQCVIGPVAAEVTIPTFEGFADDLGNPQLERAAYPEYINMPFPGRGAGALVAYGADAKVENNMIFSDDIFYFLIEHPENGVLEIPDGVKYIGDRCGWGLEGVPVVKIPDSVIEIGVYSFRDWTALREIEFGPDSKLEVLKEYAFVFSNLRSFKAPASLRTIEKGALGCPLEEVDLGNVTYIAEGPNWGTGTVGYTGDNLIIPSTVTYIGCSAFAKCTAPTVSIPESVQTIGWNAFGNVKYIVVPTTVKEIILSDYLGNIATANGKLAVPEGISYIQSQLEFSTTFRNHDYVIHYPAKGTVIEDGWIWSANRKILYSVPVVTGEKLIIPGTTQTIEAKALAGCDADEVIIEDGVRTIRERAFVKTTFSKIRLPETLTTIEEAFGIDVSIRDARNNHLTHLVIPGSVESVPNLLIAKCDTMTINEGVKDIHYDNFYRTGYTVIAATTPPSINLENLPLAEFNPIPWIMGIGHTTPYLLVPPAMQTYYQNDPAWSKLNIKPNCSFSLVDTIYAETIGKHSLDLSSMYPLSDYADRLEITLTAIEGKKSIYAPAELQQLIGREGDEYFIVVNKKLWDCYTPSSTCEFTYKLEMKMGDFYSESKKVIVKLILNKANGDSNLDGAVTVTDAINTANYAVGNEVEIFNIIAADMNEDGRITIGDASRTITAILNQPLESLQPLQAARIRARQSGDCLSINDFSLQAGQTGAIEVALKNSCDYVALQADVYAPAGMTIVGVEKGKRSHDSHSLMHSACDAAAVRVALFNFSNNSFAASDDAVFRLIVKADDDYTPGTLTIANIIASDATAKEYYLPSAVSHDDGLSGIENIAGEEAQALIAVEGRELVVSNAAGKTVRVYSTAGVAVAEFTAASDCESLPLSPGFYIVAAGNAVEKVIIK